MCGVRIEFTDVTQDEISKSCGKLCSNYESEVIAFSTSLNLINDHLKNRPLKNKPLKNKPLKNRPQDKCNAVFSDCKSALEVI